MSEPTRITDPEVRRTTPDEIAEITGWPVKVVRTMARSGQHVDKGLIFVPSDDNANGGSFVFALKPFLNWWRGNVVTPTPIQTGADAAQIVRRIQIGEQVRALADELSNVA